MGGTDSFRDPKGEMREALRQLRQSLHDSREAVVLAVMRRNRLQDEVNRVERLLVDLDSKTDLADKLKNTKLADELRAERKSREQELETLRAGLAQATAAAAAAKIRLPEDQARLLQQANDLKAQLAQLTADQVEGSAPGGFGSVVDSLWDRAVQKTRSLELEAAARREVAAASAGQATTPVPAPQMVSPDHRAEEMLAALESRLGLPPPSTTEPAPASPEIGHFLELDSAPADASPAVPPMPAGLVETPAPANPAAPAAVSTATPATTLPQNIAVARKGERSPMEPTQRVRVAGIGTGNIFRGAHLPAYPDIPQAQLVALCDPDKEAQDLAYKRFQSLVEAKIKTARERDDHATVERLESDLENIQICSDISEVIAKVKPDLVDICTQPFLHAPLSIQALEAGIHVMCEKPLSRSWLESQRLLAAIERSGKFYQHNENWLWDRDYYTAKKMVEAGYIGEPVLMYLATAHGGPEGSPKFWNPDMGGGGSLLDNGIHAIGASWYISGLEKRPAMVKAAEPFGMTIRMPNRIIDGRFQKVTVDDDAHILIRFEDPQNGAWSTAHIEGSWSHRDSPDTAIYGTTGKIVFKYEEGKSYAVVLDAYDREARRLETSGPTWQPWPSSFYGEILNMVECVRNNVPSISTAQFGADCSAIVGASYLSEKNGRKGVTPDEFKAFAKSIAERYPNDPAAADNALIEALLSAVRK